MKRIISILPLFFSLLSGISFGQTATTTSVTEKSPPVVPAACSAFIGKWVGDWGFGSLTLQIVETDAECITKYSYGRKANNFKLAEIEKEVLSFPCGKFGGTCFFEYHGDELWGRYSGSDGTGTSVFKKATE